MEVGQGPNWGCSAKEKKKEKKKKKRICIDEVRRILISVTQELANQ
jgi:hypothetical protein